MTSNQGMIFVLKIGDEWDIQSVYRNKSMEQSFFRS